VRQDLLAFRNGRTREIRSRGSEFELRHELPLAGRQFPDVLAMIGDLAGVDPIETFSISATGHPASSHSPISTFGPFDEADPLKTDRVALAV